jgi:hypothetical protein
MCFLLAAGRFDGYFVAKWNGSRRQYSIEQHLKASVHYSRFMSNGRCGISTTHAGNYARAEDRPQRNSTHQGLAPGAAQVLLQV